MINLVHMVAVLVLMDKLSLTNLGLCSNDVCDDVKCL